jgi:hypothetical protein
MKDSKKYEYRALRHRAQIYNHSSCNFNILYISTQLAYWLTKKKNMSKGFLFLLFFSSNEGREPAAKKKSKRISEIDSSITKTTHSCNIQRHCFAMTEFLFQWPL